MHKRVLECRIKAKDYLPGATTFNEHCYDIEILCLAGPWDVATPTEQYRGTIPTHPGDNTVLTHTIHTMSFE